MSSVIDCREERRSIHMIRLLGVCERILCCPRSQRKERKKEKNDEEYTYLLQSPDHSTSDIIDALSLVSVLVERWTKTTTMMISDVFIFVIQPDLIAAARSRSASRDYKRPPKSPLPSSCFVRFLHFSSTSVSETTSNSSARIILPLFSSSSPVKMFTQLLVLFAVLVALFATVSEAFYGYGGYGGFGYGMFSDLVRPRLNSSLSCLSSLP